MMWPGPFSDHSERARFQWTTCQPPVPRPSSTAVVFTTTSSPVATVPVSSLRTYARSAPDPRSTSTRCRPGRSCRIATIRPVRNDGIGRGYLQGRDEPLDPLVLRLERVFAQDGPLRLVVELQVHPVHRVVALALLGLLDEGAAQLRAGGLRRRVHRDLDVLVVRDAIDLTAALEQVVERPRPADVVVREIEQRDARVRQREVVLLAVRLDEVVLDHPVDLAGELERVRLEVDHHVLPHLERLLLERSEAVALREPQGAVQVLALDLDGRELTAVRQSHPAPAGDVVADLADRPDRVLQREVAPGARVLLEHPQEDRGRPD